PTRFVSEENFFFKLTKYKDALLKLLEDNPDFIRPAFRKGEVLTFIKEVKDFSVSRSTFTWGIPLPFDRKQVIYVWFDALINYLTAAGIEAKLKDPGSSGAREFDARWANVLHVIGKDISRFHCVFWPAMLMSMELPMPKGVFIHGFINMKGEKMSKSLGNYVTPDEVIGAVGVDAFRYYLLAENQFSNDGNFEWEALYLKCNADLANDWGNLVNRTISMARKYFPEGGLKPGTAAVSAGVRESFARLVPELRKRWDEMDPSGYITLCRERSRVLNLFIDQTKPWALAKQTTPEAKAELAEVLATVLEGIRWIATAFLPVLPEGMPKVFEQLGVPVPVEKSALVRLEWGAYAYSPNAPSPIYPRLELAKESPQA
ncbi:MAG: class I tRNA ligase family protein, partial [Bacteriovoracia bacterium]